MFLTLNISSNISLNEPMQGPYNNVLLLICLFLILLFNKCINLKMTSKLHLRRTLRAKYKYFLYIFCIFWGG